MTFKLNYLLVVLLGLNWIQAAPSPDLPGEEVSELNQILNNSANKVSRSLIENNGETRKDSTGWRAPDIETQLGRDQTLIGMGQGALFVPTMTESNLEPDVSVFRRDKQIEAGHTGRRVVLEAGTYDVKIGSGLESQKMNYEIHIVEGHTTMINPEWAGMVVETYNADGEMIDEGYEVFDAETGESYGKGYGLTLERQKDIKTWLLPRGLYKITKSGEDFNSVMNYITVRLTKGAVSPVQLIFLEDEITGNLSLVSGGAASRITNKAKNDLWSFSLRMGGTVDYSSSIDEGETKDYDLTMRTDIKFSARFDNTKYFGINELRLRNQFLKEKDSAIGPTLDEFKLNTSWVRRLNQWVGPYVRASYQSHIIAEKYKFETDTNFILVRDENNNLRRYSQAETFILKPRFFPADFAEGVGVNLELFSSYFFEFSTQLGAGFRQTFMNGVLVATKDPVPHFGPTVSTFQYGGENNTTMRLRLGRYVTIDVRGVFFVPDFDINDKILVEELTSDISLRPFRYLELSYEHSIIDHQTTAKFDETVNRFQHENRALLRVFWNF
jgi:hypothetical protein